MRTILRTTPTENKIKKRLTHDLENVLVLTMKNMKNPRTLKELRTDPRVDDIRWDVDAWILTTARHHVAYDMTTTIRGNAKQIVKEARGIKVGEPE